MGRSLALLHNPSLTAERGKPAVQCGELTGCARAGGGASGGGGAGGGGVCYVRLAQSAPRLDVGRGLVRVRVGIRVRDVTRL